jgi:hypothetical protein
VGISGGNVVNEFLVGVLGDDIVTMRPVPQRLTKEQALQLAAMLVALADDKNEFAKILEEVLSS